MCRTEKKINGEVVEQINCERRFGNTLDAMKVTFMGHQLKKENTAEKRPFYEFSLCKET